MLNSAFIYADFESCLVAGNNEKQTPEEFYTNKYQKDIAWCYPIN